MCTCKDQYSYRKHDKVSWSKCIRSTAGEDSTMCAGMGTNSVEKN